jgi:hypothetical protein
MLDTMPENSAPTLSPHYYLDNFHRLSDGVEQQYSDVLNNDELQFLQAFRGLSIQSQCLYVRLISRTGPWFRERKLKYSEISAIAPALDELLSTGFAGEAQGLSLAEAASLFTFAELLEIFVDALDTEKPSTKQNLLALLEALPFDESEILSVISTVERVRIVKPLRGEFVELLQLLFFGNRYQSLTEFVLQDLGVLQYFPYPVERTQRQFSNREAVNEYLACAELADEHRQIVEEGRVDDLPELAVRVLTFDLSFNSSIKRQHRLYNRLARDLERSEYFDLAIALYDRSERHPARERRTRILERIEQWPAARTLCENILKAPWCEAEQEAATRILPRVQRKLGGERIVRKRDNFQELQLELQREDSAVEHIAATALEQDWTAVRYVENHLFNTMFGLAFWEQIFQASPGAFNHAFQAGPLDMYDRDFRQRRGASIAKRFDELHRANLSEVLISAYEKFFPYQSHWVNWRAIDAELVSAASSVIPTHHLLAIWERMLFDPRENRKGFPDLIALGQHSGDYCLYEVKGPGDALQDSQKRWLRFFGQQDIPAQVAWVSWQT